MRRGYFAIALVLVCLRSMAQDYKVERTSSEFDRFDNFSGPTIALETRSGDKVWIYALHGRAKNGVGSFWHVGFSTVYTDTDWRFFGSASLPGGDRLEAKSLRRKVGSCAGSRCVYDEAAYVQLTREQVERASTDGFRVRWNPQRSDSIETTIPGAYFAAMVAASNNAPGGKDGVTVDNRKSGDVAATSSSTPVLPMAESEKRRADQAVIEPVQDAARRSAFLRMAPSLTPHSGGVYWIGSIEPSSDNQHPSAAVLGVACKGGGKLIVSVGTQLPIKKTWSISPPLTDVRYYFDDDETHRNWEQFGPSEAGPMTGLGGLGNFSFIDGMIASKTLKVAFEREGKADRESYRFRLDEQGVRATLVGLRGNCK